MNRPGAIEINLRHIRDRIVQASSPGQGVTLVAVSKTIPETAIEAAIEAGQRVFGENRVQEAKGKWPPMRERHSDLTLHLIGPLQTNKAADAVGLFDCIESLDRPKLARALSGEMRRQGRQPRLLVQVNTGLEPQKAGVEPDRVDPFLTQCRDEFGLSIAGVMCIPPAEEDPVPHFRVLRAIAERNRLAILSMGMSGDFERAIGEGATHVRIGSAIFGDRP